MSMFCRLFVACLVCGSASVTYAQQVTTGVPFHTGNNSFFESFRFGWGLQGKNFNFSFGGFGNGGLGAGPQFGGFQPGSGAMGGGSFNIGNTRGGFFFDAAQGSSRSSVSQTPVITTMNGQRGFVADVIQSPFVISTIPVVGDTSDMTDYGAANTLEGRFRRGEISLDDQGRLQAGPALPHWMPRAPQATPAAKPAAPIAPAAPAGGGSGGDTASGTSTADQPALSLAEIRRQKEIQSDPNAEAQSLLAQGETAEGEGKFGAARIYYRMAIKKASGDLKSEASARLKAVADK